MNQNLEQSKAGQNFQSIVSMPLDKAREKAPAVFATKPAHYIGKNYNFMPTTEIIDYMADIGYQLTNAQQSKSRSELRKDHGIHIVSFQHPDLYVKNNNGFIEARPTVLLINSHDGTRPIEFQMGLFRLVCSNGLVVKEKDFGGFRERHVKYDFNGVKQLIEQKVEMLPKTVDAINRWTSRSMTDKERFQFATEALALRMNTDRQPEQYELLSILEPKRTEDKTKDLWTTYNVIQENLIKGGFEMNERQARAITNPVADLNINTKLWELADSYVQ